jgi:hypothetical protein
MAITARFGADFSSFYDAVQKADTQLKGFEGNAAKVGKSLNTVANAFSGSKIIQQATLSAKAIGDFGGVSNLTQKELQKVGATAQEAADKFRVLGQEVPKDIQAIADAAKNAGDAGDRFKEGFNIGDAIEHPIQAAEQAIKSFGASLGPVGVAAAGVVTGILAVGSALVEMTLHAAEAGGKLDDLHQKTGISVPMLSRLSQAAQVAGTDMETIGNAIFMMDKNMAEVPTSSRRGWNASA